MFLQADENAVAENKYVYNTAISLNNTGAFYPFTIMERMAQMDLLSVPLIMVPMDFQQQLVHHMPCPEGSLNPEVPCREIPGAFPQRFITPGIWEHLDYQMDYALNVLNLSSPTPDQPSIAEAYFQLVNPLTETHLKH